MEKGKVKFFNDAKGFGFITPDHGNKDIFVHVTGIENGYSPLTQGEEVQYRVTEGKKGPQATDVRPVQ